jgi:hypothetical protein
MNDTVPVYLEATEYLLTDQAANFLKSAPLLESASRAVLEKVDQRSIEGDGRG